MEQEPFGLLTKDTIGYLQEDSNVIGKSDLEKCKHLISKGSLLTFLSDEKAESTAKHFNPPHNYKYESGKLTLTLHGNPDQVYPVTMSQRMLLDGIKQENDRIGALHNLNWVDKLKLQSKVYVAIPTTFDHVKGVVRYIGPLKQETGKIFGVELLVSAYNCNVFISVVVITCTACIVSCCQTLFCWWHLLINDYKHLGGSGCILGFCSKSMLRRSARLFL